MLLRASLGRIDDTRAAGWSDEEVRRAGLGGAGRALGVDGEPADAVVVRFPGAFPQYRVHHLLRTAGVEAALARLGASPWPVPPTAASASPPASPAAGPRRTRSL